MIARKLCRVLLGVVVLAGVATVTAPVAEAQECAALCGYSGQDGSGALIWEIDPPDRSVLAVFRELDNPAVHEGYQSVVNGTDSYAGNGIAVGSPGHCLFTANEQFLPHATTNVSQLVNDLDNALVISPAPFVVATC